MEGNFAMTHCTWDCKYHLVWVCKYRHKVLDGLIQQSLKEVLNELASIMGLEIRGLKIEVDHVHLVLSIPPKYSVAAVIGQLKAQSASRLLSEYARVREVYKKGNIWARGYYVGTAGVAEDVVRRYVNGHGGRP